MVVIHKVLSDNLEDSSPLTEVNHNCLSITSENMRPEVLSDLFKRVGINGIWDKISQQARMQLFFETHDSGQTRKKSERYLNELMDKRNMIAHPSTSLTWPDSEYLHKTVEFLKTLGQVLVESLSVIELEIAQKIRQSQESSTTSPVS